MTDEFTHDAKAKSVELKDEERTRCEVWTRVMGYFRPTDSFNIGKKSEFADRTYFKESTAMSHVH